ncbi:MAG: glycosyltransferase family 2 protein [Clostridia bacterium]|nr:glycosyltransferase family 2 protein [Clostridia bacterium]
MPEISVIVPAYNVEKYLHACLDSILAQTFTDFELILIDDGSPDSSGKICDEYAEMDSRIRVFHQENQGQAAARNFGVSQAKAEWIHFVDSDDIIHPQMLEILYDCAIRTKCNISMCGFVGGESVPDGFLEHIADYTVSKADVTDEYLVGLLKNDSLCYHSVCAKIIKKDILLKIPFEAGRTREDSAVVCQWLHETKNIAYIDKQMYFYVKNPTSTVHCKFSRKNFDSLWSFEQQMDFCDRVNFPRLKANLLCEYAVYHYILINKIKNENPDFNSYIEDLKRKASAATRKALKSPYIDKKEKLYLLELKYPQWMKWYWIISNRLKKLKRL